MAPSLVEKYQQILAADPRSRIFVELARALIERGDFARAAQACWTGLAHHPSSVQARVILGRALHDMGDLDGASQQFEVAVGVDPGNPYAFNLIGEGLARSGDFAAAVPFLARAVELQPTDLRAQEALAEAQRQAASGPPTPLLAPPRPDPDGAATAAPAPLLRRPLGPPLPVEVEVSGPSYDVPRPSPGQYEALSGPLETPPEERTLLFGELEAAEASAGAPAGAGPPPRPSPPSLPRAGRTGAAAPITILGLIPTVKAGPTEQEVPLAAPAVDAAEAARIAADYERSLRAEVAEREAAAPPPPRHRGMVVGLVASVAVAAAAGYAYLHVREKGRVEAAHQAVEAGRAGLARDTRASLTKASEVLAGVRERPPSDLTLRGQIASLAAQVAAVRAVDFGDARARSEALSLVEDPRVGDGALVVRALLAETPADRRAAQEAVLTAHAGETPLLQVLAGRLLLKKGEVEAGRGRLQLGAQAHPPLLTALADLGESYLDAGDPEAALPFLEAALSAQPTHPRAVAGAAEARVALDRPLEPTLQALQAVEKDPGSAPPIASRLRFQLAYARVEAALGDATGASRRLTRTAGMLGDSTSIQLVRAEVLLQAREFEEAEEAADRAVRLDPTAPLPQVLLARARLGRHRPEAALEALQHKDDRAVWLLRAEALLAAGQPEQARAALQKTSRNGKLSTEGAACYALTELALGHTDVALGLLDKLAAAKGPSALVHAAHGRALLAAKRPEEAAAACRAAAERAPKDPAGLLCLGRVQLAQGATAEAIATLTAAQALDKADPEIQKLLAQASAPARGARPPAVKATAVRPAAAAAPKVAPAKVPVKPAAPPAKPAARTTSAKK